MYSLVLIVATGTVSVLGTYSTADECRKDATQFKDTNVVAACVKQVNPAEQMDQAQKMMFKLMQSFKDAQ